MRILELFKKITQIPHCSGNTGALREFITTFTSRCGYHYEVDRAGNILCYRSKRDICLQSHYDMVCVGEAPHIEIYEKDGYLLAKNSSLGADNGIGVAMMLALMEEGKEAEYLFTNDEEIGLIGAKNLELRLQATKMINLDSEEFGQIYVGCAGGADIVAQREVDLQECEGNFYRVTARNFPGGHSGVDIDKNIPSAIKEFAYFATDAKVAAIEAGERRNSIPVHLQAVICTQESLQNSEYFLIERTEEKRVADFAIVKLLCAFAHGVRAWEREFAIPQVSVNLAKTTLIDNLLRIEISVRANSDKGLERIIQETLCFFDGFDREIVDIYPAWKPSITPLAKEIAREYERITKHPVSFKAIHAGLECAIFAQKFPSMQIASIGPDIINPHSVHERVKVDTIAPLLNLLRDIL
ncbi:M20/M25/M40 family metallo-hydrolase [Nitratiruptor sp. YY09-18]|uniref:M20/M25/M40 family metallo-hydrolase n=1 Tax=Nitratiruptor sp. YY09-18 TaxID=2724901 RepID=UPI0019155B0D|nr:M20/M25/M40 family metallo-hydrolase [Nitratiruptor sp. YY09-18]BCD68438.1 aminoacyl-histidine dipeptidase [Nitratiruptor sp. YY09-18]